MFNTLNVYQRTEWASNPSTGLELVFTASPQTPGASIGDFWQRAEAQIIPSDHFQGKLRSKIVELTNLGLIIIIFNIFGLFHVRFLYCR